MRIRWMILFLAVAAISVVFIRQLSTQPSFNGATPGCEGSGCHTLSGNAVTATTSNLSVSITVSGTTSNVAGELVDSTGTVVAVNNGTSSNPFTLTAPGPGRYRVNAGFKSPQRSWDSTNVRIGPLASVAGEVPHGFALEQNYPNPFNPSTTIPFSLPGATDVSLTAYDLAGHELATLVNGRMEEGRHAVRFDGTGLSSGVYFARLSAGGQTSVLKMILAK